MIKIELNNLTKSKLEDLKKWKISINKARKILWYEEIDLSRQRIKEKLDAKPLWYKWTSILIYKI